jgi:hypothetical protein
MKNRAYLKDLGVDGKVTLKRFLEKQGGKLETELM